MRKTLKKAAVVGATVLAFSGIAAGAAQAAPALRQGADIIGTGSLDDCIARGKDMKAKGEIADWACMVGSKDNTYELTPFYAN
ncbi:hypothetical protein ACFVXC_07205 [Streptomyces sp. NPDC058257]|uniref:hypothetical protein n=1 Tax=Streptomyces sp. NPDC058257 TaxID=3346409 RepID=UPI0036E4B2AD